jgi:endonuclease YncB( thermonuclease family)
MLGRPDPGLAQSADGLGCGLAPGPTRAVVTVLDAGTVRLDDGKEVRLAGILTPARDDARGHATADPADGSGPLWPPEQEARAALEKLVAGRSVALAFPPERADRHGRVRAHLFTREAQGDVWVQARLVEEGRARAHRLTAADVCHTALLARERKAREAGAGLWSHAAYQIRPADRPTELALYRHSFQLVRGHVERARRTRTLVILELASNERPAAAAGGAQIGAVRVVLRRSEKKAGEEPTPETLKRANVLVRGWIGGRTYPEITLTSAEDLEIEGTAPR